jgi:hypothetical protein
VSIVKKMRVNRRCAPARFGIASGLRLGYHDL